MGLETTVIALGQKAAITETPSDWDRRLGERP
jgi:hypothetical protein